MREVRVSTVDDYQGEENDIVLLSLVRSNDLGRIGFLNIENRVCVSLSRAKKGLYIIGNMNLLGKKCSLWRRIKTSLEAQDAIGICLLALFFSSFWGHRTIEYLMFLVLGQSLTLCCKRHGTENEVAEAEDFDRVINGGCNKICDYELECGHRCKFQCHHTDQNHTTRYVCQEAYYRCVLKAKVSKFRQLCNYFPVEIDSCRAVTREWCFARNNRRTRVAPN